MTHLTFTFDFLRKNKKRNKETHPSLYLIWLIGPVVDKDRRESKQISLLLYIYFISVLRKYVVFVVLWYIDSNLKVAI